MYQRKYYINKGSGFYQDTLIMYGFARLVDMIVNSNRNEKNEILLKDKGLYYEVILEEHTLVEEDIDNFCRNPQIGFDYIFQESKKGTKMPIHPKTKNLLKLNTIDIQKEWAKLKDKSNDNSEKKQTVTPDFSIYALFSHFSIEFLSKQHEAGSTQGGMFTRTFLQIFLNQDKFKNFLNAIFQQFSKPNIFDEVEFNKNAFPKKDTDNNTIEYLKIGKSHKIEETTHNQLISPPSSKGINSNKPRLGELSGNPNTFIEYLKLLGCFEGMFNIGGSSDFEDHRIYVIAPKEIHLSMLRVVKKAFKKTFFSGSTIKGDIFSELMFSKELLQHVKEVENSFSFSFEDIYSPSNYINGFHVCHYMTIKKSPPKKHAPINLAYLGIPSFINTNNGKDVDKWISILNDLISISRSIKGSLKNEESGDAITGLNKLRNFLSTSKIESFLDFQIWYGAYLMFAFNKKNQDRQWFVKTFKTDTLNKIFNNMSIKDFKISEITSNEGFQKVAYAIRKSTVTLQYTPKEQRHFEIRYGVAQSLQNKSKSAPDLAAYIGEFIGLYNSETARKAELSKGYRKIVREDELNEFYTLLDNYPSKVVGALLASYGFALEEKEAEEVESKKGNNESNENNNQ